MNDNKYSYLEKYYDTDAISNYDKIVPNYIDISSQ